MGMVSEVLRTTNMAVLSSGHGIVWADSREEPQNLSAKEKLSRKRRMAPYRGTPTVLLVGQIRELALYRAEVLGHHGFRVIAPQTKDEAMAAVQSGGFDVAILTYTLSSEMVEELAELIRQQHPQCPLISISQSGRIDRRIAPDEVVLADEGPTGLLTTLRRVVGDPVS